MKSVETYILLLISLLIVCYTQAQVKYTYEEVQGIWVYDNTETETDCPQMFGNEFFVFYKDNYMFIPTLDANCSAWTDFRLYKYGFTDTFSEIDIDSIKNIGEYLTYINTDGNYVSWCCFSVEPREYMEYFYKICSYLERLPKKAHSVLYKRSLYDHRNYAREFLEYDICGIKAESVQLLDSSQNATETTITKDDIVVVRDTTGNLLQVEYEPEPEKYIYGYLKREDLQFVETIDK